jgi:hypothetical protein
MKTAVVLASAYESGNKARAKLKDLTWRNEANLPHHSGTLRQVLAGISAAIQKLASAKMIGLDAQSRRIPVWAPGSPRCAGASRTRSPDLPLPHTLRKALDPREMTVIL